MAYEKSGQRSPSPNPPAYDGPQQASGYAHRGWFGDKDPRKETEYDEDTAEWMRGQRKDAGKQLAAGLGALALAGGAAYGAKKWYDSKKGKAAPQQAAQGQGQGQQVFEKPVQAQQQQRFQGAPASPPKSPQPKQSPPPPPASRPAPQPKAASPPPAQTQADPDAGLSAYERGLREHARQMAAHAEMEAAHRRQMGA